MLKWVTATTLFSVLQNCAIAKFYASQHAFPRLHTFQHNLHNTHSKIIKFLPTHAPPNLHHRRLKTRASIGMTISPTHNVPQTTASKQQNHSPTAPHSTTTPQNHNPTKPNALGHRNKRRPNTNTVKAPTTGKRPQQHNTTDGPSGQPARCQRSGLTSGNVIVSRIVAPVNAMSSRSMPMPMPPAGGMPTPSASRKSSSMSPASSSPASESFA